MSALIRKMLKIKLLFFKINKSIKLVENKAFFKACSFEIC
jgi:hypothetical protein